MILARGKRMTDEENTKLHANQNSLLNFSLFSEETNTQLFEGKDYSGGKGRKDGTAVDISNFIDLPQVRCCAPSHRFGFSLPCTICAAPRSNSPSLSVPAFSRSLSPPLPSASAR